MIAKDKPHVNYFITFVCIYNIKVALILSLVDNSTLNNNTRRKEMKKNNGMKLANMDAGKSLRQLMSRDSVSRSDMAKALSCTQPYVSSMRKSKSISASKLVEVCEFFKITASEFFKLGEE